MHHASNIIKHRKYGKQSILPKASGRVFQLVSVGPFEGPWGKWVAAFLVGKKYPKNVTSWEKLGEGSTKSRENTWKDKN